MAPLGLVALALGAPGTPGTPGAPGAPAGKPPKVIVVGSPEPSPSEAGGAARKKARGERAADEADRGIPVAQVSFVETRVDVRAPGGEWRRLPEGGRVRTGDGLRTGPDSVARIEFPWMSAALAPGTELGLSKGAILGLTLRAGRVELASGRDDIIKLDTSDARVRGNGWVVVRREDRTTRLSVLRGEVSVRAGGRVGVLKAGAGCAVGPRRPCLAAELPRAPAGLQPGPDPPYVVVGERLSLTWRAEAPSFHVQVLAFDSDAVLMRRDVAAPPLEVAVPWPGLYRWRVSARDAQGLEGAPSPEGLFQVMPRGWLPEAARLED